MKQTKQRKIIAAGYFIALTAAIVCLVFSAWMLIQYYMRANKERAKLENLAQTVAEAAQPTQSGAPVDPEAVLRQYQKLAEQNEDMIGWITIEGTPVNYPVMHTPRAPEYYLRRDFDQQWSQSGMPFLDAANTPDTPGTNQIIYGHNMKDKSMFAAVAYYLDADYFAQHRTVRFDTTQAYGTYTVFAVFHLDASVGNEAALQCYTLRDTQDAARMDSFLAYVNQYAALVDNAEFPVQGDTLLTLSTCDNIEDTGRIVVMAKKTA